MGVQLGYETTLNHDNGRPFFPCFKIEAGLDEGPHSFNIMNYSSGY